MSLTVKIVLAAALILSIAVRQRTALFRHADNRIRPHVLRPGLCRR